jgi:GAF domain-containing protein
MSVYKDDLTGDFLQPLDDAIGKAERLTAAMKTPGFVFTSAAAQDMETLKEKLATTRQGAKKAVGDLQQLQKLVETSALLTSSLELDRVLEQVMDAVIVLTHAQRAYLMLRDTASGDWSVRAARNWDGANISKDYASFSRGIVDMAVEQKQPILTDNAQVDDRFQQRESITLQSLRSIVCIPLVLRGEAVGVLYADNRIQEGVFNVEMIPMVTAFANQAAIAIENSRLFEQVKMDLMKAQHEVQTLRIQIDKHQADSQIEEITSSDVFRRLARQDDPPTDK